MYSGRGHVSFLTWGFPIRTSPAQRSVGNSPELFAATHVLLRLLAPRHPPHALSSLLTLIPRRPASRRQPVLETKVQAPALRCGPGRMHLLEPTCFPRAWPLGSDSLSAGESNFSQQKLNSTLRMQLSKNGWLPLLGKPNKCGADRDRTDDIQLAKLALSQLSYSPGKFVIGYHLPAVIASPLPPMGNWWA